MIQRDNSGLFQLLDEINKRPQLQQLGQRPQAQAPQSLFDLAAQEQAGQQEAINALSGLAEQVESAGGGSGNGILEDTATALAQNATTGAVDSIFSGEDAATGLRQSGGNLGLLAGNMVANKVSKDYGFDDNKGSVASDWAGRLAGTAFLGPVGGVLGGLLGRAANDYTQDYRNTRAFESPRDYLEDTLGGFADLKGRREYSNLAQDNMFGGWSDVQSQQLNQLKNQELNNAIRSTPEHITSKNPLWSTNDWDYQETSLGGGNNLFSRALADAYEADKALEREIALAREMDMYGGRSGGKDAGDYSDTSVSGSIGASGMSNDDAGGWGA